MMQLRENQPRCWALWFFFFSATRQLVKTITEQGQSLQETEVIIFTLTIWQRCGLQTGRKDTEGGRCCRKWQWRMKKQSFKRNPVFLGRYDTAGRLKAEKGRQKGCTSAFCTFSSNVLFCLNLFFCCCFSGQLLKFCKRLLFPKQTKKSGYSAGVSYLWIFFSILFFWDQLLRK